MEALIVVIVLFVIACVIGLGRSMKVIQQYEKGVLYRFGRVDSQLLEPGLVFIRPIGDRQEFDVAFVQERILLLRKMRGYDADFEQRALRAAEHDPHPDDERNRQHERKEQS